MRSQQEREVSGMFGDVRLTLAVDLLRVQWTVDNIPAEAGGEITAIPTIGSYTDRQVWFRDLMTRWLEHAPPITIWRSRGGSFSR